MPVGAIDKERLPDAILAEVPRHAEQGDGGDHRPRNEDLKLESLDLELLAAGAPGELECEERQHDGEQEEGEPGERGP